MFTNQMPIIQSRVKLLSLLLLLLLLIFGGSSNALASSSSPPDPATFDVVELPPEALTLADDFVTGVRTAGNPKLDAVLTDLTTQGAVTAADAADLTQPQLLRFSGSRVQVHIDIQAAGVDPVVQAVHAAGGEVTGIGRSNTLIQGWLPVEALSTVAAHPDVHLIRRPARAIRFQGHSVTEGAAVMEVSPWHEAGWRGQGIKVGIIDGDFQGYRNLSGVELPATVTTRNFVDDETDAQVDGKDVHGTAIAEIVHDIAPDAELYLAKIETLIDQEEAVAWLKDEQNVDIISTSIGWFGRFPGDGTGDLADLVRDVRAAGILWVTSAGNHGLSHWGGPYSDPDGDDIHNFAGKQEINHFGPGDGRAYGIPRGILIAVCARWSDWVKVDQDYDLHLVRWNNTMSRWELFASGRNPQTGAPGQTPTECAARVTAGSTTVYGFFIERIKGTKPVNFDIFELGSLLPFDTAVHARSLLSLADAPDAVTVAAVDVNPPHHQEPYSSEGPTNGPGGTEIGGFIKPNLAAYTNVSTASGNGQLFGGTSAATPHVAGAAALVQSRFPDFAPDQVQTFLEERAIDMGPPGVDTIFGYGRLHLGGCTVSISPTSHSFESDGGASSINVVDDTCNWTV
ncbi:S8 family serine peptidase [Chloroflexi bacterium TSY]|nr:S8 family serine peptidase [Chloroflexi bacterium TSY]